MYLEIVNNQTRNLLVSVDQIGSKTDSYSMLAGSEEVKATDRVTVDMC